MRNRCDHSPGELSVPLRTESSSSTFFLSMPKVILIRLQCLSSPAFS